MPQVRAARPVAILVLGLVVALPASSSARSRAVVELGLWPAGQGKIEATLEGSSTVLQTCTWDQSSVIATGTPCPVAVEEGSRVTLVATGADADSPFLHWDRFDCEGTSPCTVTVNDNEDLVVATFRKQRLEVLIEGTGKVTSTNPELSCESTCLAWVDAGTEVVLNAEGAHTWARGCEPDGGNPASARCSLTMSNLRTFAKVGFGVEPGNDLPFDVRVRLRVQRRGSGGGRVTAQGKDADGADWRIDCGATCTAANLDLQSRVTLRAEEESGSRFVRWLGVCSTDPECRFSAGTQKVVGAVFDPVAPPSPPKYAPKVTKVTVVGRGPQRAVVLRITVDRRTTATLRLVRGRATLKTRRFTLAVGRTDVRFALPKGLKPGRYRIAGRFVSMQGELVPFDKPFTLRR